MSKTVKMLLVVSLTMAFAAFLYKDELTGTDKESASTSHAQETSKSAYTDQAPVQGKANDRKKGS